MNNSTRVVFNTGVLYAKLIVGMVIGLITIRIVLDALGETDYGIYTLVAGVVGLLGILNSSMSHASMRFIAHSLGTGDREKTLKTFNTTLFLHFVIGAIVVIIIEIGGLFMFEYVLNIPAGKIFDAKIVFHLMVATTFVSIISVPYDAVMNSHEDILALSLVDIFGYIFKLGIAIFLTFSSLNLLILYGSLVLASQVIQRVIKQVYSKIKYEECKIRFKDYADKELGREILSFTGWNMFGSVASMTMTQVRGIILNYFFGVGINAAEGISKKAGGQVNMVATSMTRALNPQLVKSEGAKDRSRMLYLTNLGTKYSVYLFALFTIPVFFEAEFLLNIWLKDVPEYSVIFCQLILLNLFIEKFSFEITSAIRAVGDIRNFQMAETFIVVLNIPTAFYILYLGFPPYSIFYISIGLSVIIFCERLYFGKHVATLDIKYFINKAVLPVLFPVIISMLSAYLMLNFMDMSWRRIVSTTITSIFFLTVAFWTFGIQNEEKNKISHIIKKSIKKISK